MAKFTPLAAILVAPFVHRPHHCLPHHRNNYGQGKAAHAQSQSQSGRRDSTSEQQQLEQCCDQLRDMSRRCRCDGLSELVSEQLGHLQGEERREILQIARNLPNECNLRPGRCDSEIRSN
uniref:Bifunctional inhibitor/plant lipid transfer protein/seed storage helical domain-containing protein n=1 Tax=Fagus sylvatica TaxID=28930 RepID=A0A2N9ESN7_FAGSY